MLKAVFDWRILYDMSEELRSFGPSFFLLRVGQVVWLRVIFSVKVFPRSFEGCVVDD